MPRAVIVSRIGSMRHDDRGATTIKSGSFVTAFASARPGIFARVVLALGALGALAVLSSCGSGAVTDQPPAGSTTLTVTPGTGTLYTDSPFSFLITGGTGTYVATSSDQLALPVVNLVTGHELTVVAGPVSGDTPVTLTVRDTGSAAPVTAVLTVKARTVSNVVTVTPSASQSAACGTAVCAGGDAEVRVQLSQSGLPLANRTVRFDVVSGEFRIITSAPGAPETLGLTGTSTSDQTGIASIRIRVLGDALSQTALLQVTDVATGFNQRTSFAIAPSSNAPLNAQPSTINFQGVTASTCASGISADVIVFGGRPPYQISQPGSFLVSPTTVIHSGDRFTVTAIGQCTAGTPIAVVDSNGATVSVNASNLLSAVEPVDPPEPPAARFGVSSRTAALTSCSAIANITLSGGSGTYFATSGDSRVKVIVNGNLGSISAGANADPGMGSVPVTFSDGEATVPVIVDLTVLDTGLGATC